MDEQPEGPQERQLKVLPVIGGAVLGFPATWLSLARCISASR